MCGQLRLLCRNYRNRALFALIPAQSFGIRETEGAVDIQRFDDLVRSIATTSRRGLLRRVVTTAVAAALGGSAAEADAQSGRRPGEICRKDGECASGLCNPPDPRGRR